ncbi:hypothetical protein ACFSO0_02505 [Brevibacillus sp. GCM10020057]|uniref:hypothetical protein n=1 Tax=Brevibacillus sp. GCM10020057 TaxID=3317327 RepID=UPI00363F5E65
MAKKFKDLFPDYKAYSNEDYLMNKVTYQLLKELSFKLPKLLAESVYVRKGLNLNGTLRNMCDIVSGYTNNDKTTNWGWDFIIKDFENQMLDFQDLKFHKFMDCVVDLKKFILNPVQEFNDIFEEHDFGYRLTDDLEKPWICVNPNIGMVIHIKEVIATTKEVCKQTADHIKQAKEQLTRATESRARKDAIRDCLSAMEALMKKLTNTKSIDDADRLMRADRETWGPKVIVSEGIKLWKLFHEDYTDIRHGDFNNSEITYEEAIYFVERILSFVKYISTRTVDDKEIELIF